MSHLPPPRTLNQAVSDVKYAVRYGELNERFWRRLDTALQLVGALGGSAAVASVLGRVEAAGLVAGVAMATAATLQLVLRPMDRAVGFRDARRQFMALEARAWSLDVVQLDAERQRLEADAPIGFEALSMPAWNALARSLGREQDVRPLTLAQRLALMLA